MVIRLRPDFAKAYGNRCIAYNRKGQFANAFNDCSQAIELQPDSAEAYNDIGYALQGNGQWNDAIVDYDKAIALRPDFVQAYQNRAMAHTRMEAYDKAWSDVQTIRKLGGTPAPAVIEELKNKSGRAE